MTFMYEEDRQQALNMYEAMFESAQDEHSLMQVLVSPTRQAVVIARAYDAKESSLQVYSLSREEEGIDDDAELPGFVLAIDEVYQAAARKGIMDNSEPVSTVLDDQLSLFEDDAWPMEQEEEPEAVEAVEEVLPAEDPAIEPEPEPADEVDAFLASFAIDESELVPAAAEEAAEAGEPVEKTEEAPVEEAEEPEAAAVEVQTEIAAVTEEPGVPEKASVPTATVRKPRIFLMILYIIAAIPLTIVGIALLLVPTVIVGALAASVIMTGSASFVAAFSGFAVFADMLVVLGTALIVSAVGLILFWLFIWFIGGAIVGLIKAVVNLGAKCCYKEVPVNG